MGVGWGGAGGRGSGGTSTTDRHIKTCRSRTQGHAEGAVLCSPLTTTTNNNNNNNNPHPPSPQAVTVEDEEFCAIPMGGCLPVRPQRVIGVGGTAGMVHPSTGYMVSRVIGAAPLIADAIIDQLSAGGRGVGRGGSREERRSARARRWTDAGCAPVRVPPSSRPTVMPRRRCDSERRLLVPFLTRDLSNPHALPPCPALPCPISERQGDGCTPGARAAQRGGGRRHGGGGLARHVAGAAPAATRVFRVWNGGGDKGKLWQAGVRRGLAIQLPSQATTPPLLLRRHPNTCEHRAPCPALPAQHSSHWSRPALPRLQVLLKLDLAETREFFAAFFSLSDYHWHGFLSSRLSFLNLIGFGLSLFARSSNAARLNLLQVGCRVCGAEQAGGDGEGAVAARRATWLFAVVGGTRPATPVATLPAHAPPCPCHPAERPAWPAGHAFSPGNAQVTSDRSAEAWWRLEQAAVPARPARRVTVASPAIAQFCSRPPRPIFTPFHHAEVLSCWIFRGVCNAAQFLAWACRLALRLVEPAARRRRTQGLRRRRRRP